MDNPVVGLAAALCAAVAVLVALVAADSGRRRRRHRLRMRQWAGDNGWTYTPRAAVDWGSQLPGGNRNGITETFSALLGGRHVTVAEYSVTDASDGTSTNTHWYVVTAAALHHPPPATRSPTWTVTGTELLSWHPGRLDPDDIPGHAAAAVRHAASLDG